MAPRAPAATRRPATRAMAAAAAAAAAPAAAPATTEVMKVCVGSSGGVGIPHHLHIC